MHIYICKFKFIFPCRWWKNYLSSVIVWLLVLLPCYSPNFIFIPETLNKKEITVHSIFNQLLLLKTLQTAQTFFFKHFNISVFENVKQQTINHIFFKINSLCALYLELFKSVNVEWSMSDHFECSLIYMEELFTNWD